MKTRIWMKRGLARVGAVIALVAPVLAVQISLDPVYENARFEPADKLHAGCLNTVKVQFKSEGQEVENVHLVLEYNPKDIQIVSVESEVADENLLNYNIGYDTIVLNFLNQKAKKLSNVALFTLQFKSLDTLASTVLSVDEEQSYVLLKNSEKVLLKAQATLLFAKAEECTPDVLPPTIGLIFPKDNKEKLPLDADFAFEIRDTGKGINKDSVKVFFAGEEYTMRDVTNLIWKDDTHFVFYPKNRLPVDTQLSLGVSISDNQVYGGANESKQEISFTTADKVLLQNFISPASYRRIVNKADTLFGSEAECKMLKQLYGNIDTTSQKLLHGIFTKLSCDTTDLAAFFQYPSSDLLAHADLTTPTNKKISVLSVLGRLLFGIALSLKLHYYLAYRKHKKLCEQLANNA